jgi:uncharacterized delta-60 repeat protein
MKVIDQNSAAAALEKALVPGPSLIDGRTEQEQLAFLCRFASLLNFYDQDNTMNGNWQPFLLKDPVFLLAYISETDYQKEHHLFVKTCAGLQVLIDAQNKILPDSDPELQGEIVMLFNRLFDLLTRIYLHIEQWTHYMQMGSESYDLKNYVINQVKNTFNSYLWAVFSLRNFLWSSSALSVNTYKQIAPVSDRVLNSFTDLIWTKGGGTAPFMQVLGLYTINEIKNSDNENEPGSSGPIPQGIVITTQDYLDGLKSISDKLFKFYRTIVHHAGTEYEKVKTVKSAYPDTLLLRTFESLLKVHQDQLNEIANKHLDFYYSAVLKQSELPAIADSVFITTVLGKNVTVFDLPAGTLFNAGTDAQKNPILFASGEAVSLNAATITNAFTLATLTPVVSNVPADGTIDASFTPGETAPGSIAAIAVQSDGKIIAAGSFSQFDNVTVNGIIRLNSDGNPDTVFIAATGTGLGTGDTVSVIAIQGDGKIILGGSIKSFNGTAVSNIVRLNTDGTIDTTFTAALDNSIVHVVVLQGDGKMIIASELSTTSRELASSTTLRLNTDGSPDNSFQQGALKGRVLTAALKRNGKIILGGSIKSFNGADTANIICLDTDGTQDNTFKAATDNDGVVNAIALQNDGKIIVAEDLSVTSRRLSSKVLRLDADGAIDESFNAGGIDKAILSCAIQWDGKIIIAGKFSSVSSVPVNGLARLLTDGTLDTTFNFAGQTGINTPVPVVALQHNGQIIIAEITGTGANAISQLVRLNSLMNPSQFLLQNIATPGVITTNEAQQALSWETFGGTINMDGTPATIKSPAFAFASPMLFLPEGSRQVIISFGFDKFKDPSVFNNAQIFLSTSSAWLSVPYAVLPPDPRKENTFRIEITLDPTQPPITAFTKNPDGLNGSWPMLKLIFNSSSGLTIPPVLTSIKIDVCVTGVNTFALYNDNGLLSTKNPFQLFGPIVNMNSNFLVGSNEIFSKPLKWLSIELDWDTLPALPASPPAPTITPTPLDKGFGYYYNSYNTILFPDVQTIPALSVSQNFSPQKKSIQVTAKKPAAPQAVASNEAAKPETSPGKFRTFLKKLWNVVTLPFRIIFWPVIKLVSYFSKRKQSTTLTSEAQAKTATPTASPFVPPAPPSPGQSVPFTNICFTVEFSMLNAHAWDSFYMYNYGGNTTYSTWLSSPCNGTQVWPDGKPVDFQLFDTESDLSDVNGLANKTVFGYFASDYDTPVNPDPSIQNTPLVFDGTNSSGFIKMTLTNPVNGFGASVYPNVVTQITTNNALAISQAWPWSKPTITPAANAPFSPKVQAMSAGYGASQVYDLTKAPGNYPLQYFYYTPFANYTAYDNSPALQENYSPVQSVAGQCPVITGLPLVPSFACNDNKLPCSGAMFIGLSGLISGNAVSFFFELSTTYAAPASGAAISYYYLSTKGWKTLPLQNDGTNEFTCSGIITVNIPADIDPQSAAMPAGSWLAIAAAGSSGTLIDLSSFAQVILLSPNGVKLTRTGTDYLTDTVAPVINALTITKPQTAIPQIGTIVQPFASFGGRAAENKMQMYERVSNRLKTKDRAVSGNDIFTLIKQQFPDIYFSGAVFSPDTNATTVYVVEGFDDPGAANAYRPFVSECEMEAITRFLEKRISLFSNISVSNYSFQSIQVAASVTVKQGFVPQAMSAAIVQALNIYFSPWIAVEDQQQVMIGQPVTSSQVAAFIRGINGVEAVKEIQLLLPGQSVSTAQTLTPPAGTLFVSSLNHIITAAPVE